MKEDDFLEKPLARAERLRVAAGQFSVLEPAARLGLRLGEACAAGTGEAVDRPVTIVLVGGSGTGKSALFNALIDAPEASPTSATRAHTKTPCVAAGRRDLSLLNALRDAGARHVPCDLEGISVVDTPDLDSVEEANRQVARKVVEAADVVVYVTIPDRVSDFMIHQEIRSWAMQKRWFFVLNKSDLYSDSLEEIRLGFDERLRDLGFIPDDRVRFLLSAKHPDRYEFEAFKRAVFSSRTRDKVRALRSDVVLGMVENAVNDDEAGAPLAAVMERLQQKEAALDRRLRQLYRTALETDSAREAARLLLRNRTWQNLASRTGWIIGMVIWVRCRAALLSSAWHLGRMATKGPTLFGLMWIGVAAIVGAVRGVLPLRNLRAALGGEFERELKEVERDATRAIEDEGLQPLDEFPGRTTSAKKEEVYDAWVETVRAVPGVGNKAARAIETTSRHRTLADDLVGPLQDAIEDAAARAARQSAGFFIKILANALPTAVLAHVAWRVGEAWYLAQWLPAGFYALAITVFLLSLLPGYLLVGFSVAMRTRKINMDTAIENIHRPGATVPLRTVREALQDLIREIDALRRVVATMRQTLGSELPIESFGARADSDGPSPREGLEKPTA